MRAKSSLSEVFAILERHAVSGHRCPENGTFGIEPGFVPMLAREGRIRVEISSRNYRTVVILVGPHAGKCTAPDPAGRKPWKIIDAGGVRTIKRVNPDAHPAIGKPRKRQLLPRIVMA